VRLFAWTVLAIGALSAPERQTAVERLSDRDAIPALVEGFMDAWNHADAERAVAVYTDLHVDVNASVSLESRDMTRSRWRRFFDRFDSRIVVTSDELIIAGNGRSSAESSSKA
jgi:ketosteroid isomerase-like protein